MTKKVSYSGVVLDDSSRAALLDAFGSYFPEDWEVVAHHMTIKMGPLDGAFEKLRGIEAEMTVTHFAMDDKVAAVQVTTSVPSKNHVKHITLAVNRNAGGKPFHSNKLKDWETADSVKLFGVITEQ